MDKNVLPADTFFVVNKTTLNDNDRKLIVMLYQPIIGTIAVNLYFTFWSYLDKSEIISNDWTHHHLMTSMRLKLSDIKQAREKLEAIGLIKTYLKCGNVNSYVYQMFSPLSASEFLNNPILGTTLYNNVGASEYDKIIDYFRIPHINLKDYEDITCTFSDIFESTDISSFDNMIADIRKNTTNKLQIASKIDIENIASLTPEEMFNRKCLTRETKDFIYKLSFIYNFDDEKMSELIRNSLNERKGINKALLKENARRFYQFEHSGKLPSLVYRNQPEYLRKPVGDNSKKAKIIYQCETTSPYDFLCSKSNGSKPTKAELSILEYLLMDMNLKPGVVNVLIDYVLKINNNKLTRNFIEIIASQWAKSKVETVESAMKIAEKEYKNRKKYTPKNKREEIKPDWFDKQIETTKPSDEKLKKMQALLSEFK